MLITQIKFLSSPPPLQGRPSQAHIPLPRVLHYQTVYSIYLTCSSFVLILVTFLLGEQEEAGAEDSEREGKRRMQARGTG